MTPAAVGAACSTGWLSHWGEVMANTSASFVLKTLNDILSYQNGTGSVNFYMAHGGSNFGYWAGACAPGTGPHKHCRMAGGILGGCLSKCCYQGACLIKAAKPMTVHAHGC